MFMPIFSPHCMGICRAYVAMTYMPLTQTLLEMDLAKHYVVGIHDEGLCSK